MELSKGFSIDPSCIWYDNHIHIKVTKLEESPTAEVTDNIKIGEERKGCCTIDSLPSKDKAFMMSVYERNGRSQEVGSWFHTSDVQDIVDYQVEAGILKSIKFLTINSIYLLEILKVEN
jgi:hypothetical protein